MSEFINNQAYRQEELKRLIKKLHAGATVDEVQEEFATLIQGVSATEITQMEQALVNEGLAVAEIQKLCDVHAAVFKGSIEDIHKDDDFEIANFDDGHPIHTFKKENRAIERLIEEQLLPYLSQYTETKDEKIKALLSHAVEKLWSIERHYTRKEQIVFPYMEQYGITAPTQVMWGVDDEIRDRIKSVRKLLQDQDAKLGDINSLLRETIHHVQEMIFKEEEIMFPMTIESFTLDEWQAIEAASAEVGYTLLSAVKRWRPQVSAQADVNDKVNQEPRGQSGEQSIQTNNKTNAQTSSQAMDTSRIPFDAGSLTQEEVNAILNTVPVDMTFVGADNRVKYFTQGKERIFDRPITIIGREVKHCHPPKSVHIVEQIVEELRSGKKDNEDFWIKMGEQFIHIRYFAVRGKTGEFLGTLEVTQNIKPIIELEGEKRLMS